MTTSQSHTAQIRQALNLAFDDSALSAFCFDYFREVYDRFSQQIRKDDKITLLLDHCRRRPTGFETFRDVVRKEYEISDGKREELNSLIDALEAFLNPSRRITRPLGIPMQLPPAPEHFTARKKEVAQLKEDLQANQVVTLCGPAGVGKTALAAEVLWQLARSGKLLSSFPDGIIFHSFYDEPSATLALQEIARAFGEDPLKGTPASAAKRALAGRRALLLLDGAEKTDNLPAVLAVRSSCGVLVTSRHRTDALAKRLDISPLATDKAIALLQAWGGEQAADSGFAGQICDLLGGLPLAVRLAGRYLSAMAVDAVDYLEWLSENPLTALDQGKRQSESVPLLLEKSLQQVSETALQALAVVGMLASTPFERSVVAFALEISLGQVARLLGELVNYGLLVRIPSQKLYQMSHVLVHTYAWQRLTTTDVVADRLAAYYDDLARKLRQSESWTSLNAARPHIMVLLGQLANRKRWKAALSLSAAYVEHLEIQGYWQERISAIEIGLAAAEALADQHNQAAFLGLLGLTYRDLGQSELAIEFFEHALAIARSIDDRSNEKAWLDHLGNSYREQGKIEQAIQFHEQALAIASNIGDHRAEGNSDTNLGR